jgi:nicotinate-nucleotide--dimethylbenzimidazole phosphoribosyltransferase
VSDLPDRLRRSIDRKTKPPGSLGVLEDVAFRIGLIQNTVNPTLVAPTIVVFAGDHGAATAGISSYPQEVTHQMVLNFLRGGAGINVFCNANHIDLKIVDAGVNFDFPKNSELIDAKIAASTRNYLEEPAMNEDQRRQCFFKADQIVASLAACGTNIVGFGDMGIGNTASASLILSAVCNIPIERCTGRGAGADDAQLKRKIALLKTARSRHPDLTSPEQILRTFGGFEIAQITGAMLSAHRHDMIILVDGFISTAAYLVAHAVEPAIGSNVIFSHLSDERGHRLMLGYLGARPLLQLSMRLGEGTGCAMAYPLIRCAVAFLNEMASFESAGVSSGSD